MAKFIRIYSTICNALYRILVPFAVVSLVLWVAGIRTATVISGSMEPTIPTWSVALVNVRNLQPEVGDVITYHRGEDIILHRVVDIQGSEYITQGDANQYPDPPVSQEQVAGVVLWHIPFVGKPVQLFLAVPEPVQIPSAIVIAVLFLVGVLLYKDPKEGQKK